MVTIWRGSGHQGGYEFFLFPFVIPGLTRNPGD